jgi:undecaprenyl diphosphate synthase
MIFSSKHPRRSRLQQAEGLRHIAIIMDGNGRWARRRGLPRVEGHRKGVQRVREIIRAAAELDLTHITLFAFSVENWRRPDGEVSALMELLADALDLYVNELIDNDVRLRVIGRMEALPESVRERLERAIEATRGTGSRQLVVALNYGARQEAVEAAQAFARDVQAGRADPEQLDWPGFSAYLNTDGIPDPDLLIRTSGESRLSNFLLLQLAYAELYFTPVAWPDFDRNELFKAVQAYRQRERRFGLITEQLPTPETLTPK